MAWIKLVETYTIKNPNVKKKILNNELMKKKYELT